MTRKIIIPISIFKIQDWELPDLFEGTCPGVRNPHIPKMKAKTKRKAARKARRKNR